MRLEDDDTEGWAAHHDRLAAIDARTSYTVTLGCQCGCPRRGNRGWFAHGCTRGAYTKASGIVLCYPCATAIQMEREER